MGPQATDNFRVNIDFNQFAKDGDIPADCQTALQALFEQYSETISFKSQEPYDIFSRDGYFQVCLSQDLVRRFSRKKKMCVYQILEDFLGAGDYGQVRKSSLVLINASEKYVIKRTKDRKVKKVNIDNKSTPEKVTLEWEVTKYMYGAKELVKEGDDELIPEQSQLEWGLTSCTCGTEELFSTNSSRSTRYIITKMDSGKSLADYSDEGFNDFSFEEVCRIMVRVLGQIRKLHRQYTHGDLYARNIIYDRKTGQVGIVDFGCSKRKEHNRFFEQDRYQDFTSFGELLICMLLPDFGKNDDGPLYDRINEIVVPDDYKEQMKQIITTMLGECDYGRGLDWYSIHRMMTFFQECYKDNQHSEILKCSDNDDQYESLRTIFSVH